jgi:4-hydroxy-tetrahydrodipicolinate synthase
MLQNIEGVLSVLPTPFDEERKIDFQDIDSLVEFALRAKVNGIVILGITGEANRLSDNEKLEVVKRVVSKVSKRVPVVAGIGNPSTDVAIWFCKEVKRIGVDGLMVLPPKLRKPEDEAIISYYKQISDEVGLPIVVQDEPVTSGVFMRPVLIAKIWEKVEAASCLKLEDPPTAVKIAKLRSLLGDGMKIFGGLGALYYMEELERGANGIMTGFAYPEVLVKIYDLFVKGDVDEAAYTFYKFLPLIRYEAQPVIGLSIRKHILYRRGVIKNPLVRPPGANIDEATKEELDRIINRLSTEMPGFKF